MHAVKKQQMISMKIFEWWKWVQYGLSNMYVNVICSLIKNSDPWMHIHIYPLVISIKKLKSYERSQSKLLTCQEWKLFCGRSMYHKAMLWMFLWFCKLKLRVVEIYIMLIFLFEIHSIGFLAGEYYPHYNIQNFHNDPNTPALNFQM